MVPNIESCILSGSGGIKRQKGGLVQKEHRNGLNGVQAVIYGAMLYAGCSGLSPIRMHC